MSYGAGGRKDKKGTANQFGARQNLTKQRSAYLAPVQRWRKEWTAPTATSGSGPLSNGYQVCKWVRVTETNDEMDREETAMNLSAAKDGPALAGLTDMPTPGVSGQTPVAAQTPAASEQTQPRSQATTSNVPKLSSNLAQSSTLTASEVEDLASRQGVPGVAKSVDAAATAPMDMDAAPAPSKAGDSQKVEHEALAAVSVAIDEPTLGESMVGLTDPERTLIDNPNA